MVLVKMSYFNFIRDRVNLRKSLLIVFIPIIMITISSFSLFATITEFYTGVITGFMNLVKLIKWLLLLQFQIR